MKKKFFTTLFCLLGHCISSCGTQSSFLTNDLADEENITQNEQSHSHEEENSSLKQNNSNTTNEDEIISLDFQKNKYNILINEIVTIGYRVVPVYAPREGIIYSCDDNSIIDIIDPIKGKIKAKKVGETTLYVKSPNGIVGSCKVRVNLLDLQDIKINKDKIELEVGVKLEDDYQITPVPLESKQNIKSIIEDVEIAKLVDNKIDIHDGKAGQTNLIVFNDENNNGVPSENEITKKIPIYVHDYNVEPKIVKAATCLNKGSKSYLCKCGCGQTKFDTIPEIGHDFSILVEHKDSTCVLAGFDKYKCKHPGCNETHTEILATSHTPTNKKEICDELFCCPSDGVDLAQYYYRCTTCGKAAVGCDTFGYGNGDYLYKVLPQIFDDETTVSRLRASLEKVVKLQKENYYKDVSSAIYFYPSDKINKSICFNYWATYSNIHLTWYHGEVNQITTKGSTFIKGRAPVPEQYRKAQDRLNIYEPQLKELVRQSKKLIGNNKSERQKVKIIYDFVIDYYTYDKSHTHYNCLISSLDCKSAVCGNFANLFNYLCKYNGLDCIGIAGNAGGQHAWNTVCVENKWYLIDCTWGEADKKQYFLKGSNDIGYYSTPLAPINIDDFGVTHPLSFLESHTPAKIFNIPLSEKSIRYSDLTDLYVKWN